MISLLILFSVTNVLDLYNWVTERSQLCIHLNPDILEMCFITEFTIAIIRKLLMDPMWALSEVIIAAVPALSQQTWEPPAMGSGPLSCLVWLHSWITAGADRASLGECSLREGQTPAIHSADDLQQKETATGICYANTAVPGHRLSCNLTPDCGSRIQVTRLQ